MTTRNQLKEQTLEDVKAEIERYFKERDFRDNEAYDIIHEVVDSNIPIYHRDLLEIAQSNLWLSCVEPECLPSKDKITPVKLISLNIYDQLIEDAYTWY